MSVSTNARIGARYPADEHQTRAQASAFAEIGPELRAFAEWAERSPEFAELASNHPARRALRAIHRAEAGFKDVPVTDQILATASADERARAAAAIVIGRRANGGLPR